MNETTPPSLSTLLTDLLAERGMSKRGFAKRLAEADGRQSWQSWLTSVKRYTREDDPITPHEDTVALMEKVLTVPPGTLIRQTRREQLEDRVRTLEAENQRLRAELEKRRLGERRSSHGRDH